MEDRDKFYKWRNVAFTENESGQVVHLVFTDEKSAMIAMTELGKWKNVSIHIIKMSNDKKITTVVSEQKDKESFDGKMLTRMIDVNTPEFISLEKRLNNPQTRKFLQLAFLRDEKLIPVPVGYKALLPLHECFVRKEEDYPLNPMQEAKGIE